MRRLLISLIRTYQVLFSPWLGQHCRFHPSCSNYAMEAIRVHGPLRGLWLALQRLGRCHPWHEGGYDPVPSPTAPLITPGSLSSVEDKGHRSSHPPLT
ncbi:MAG TPA: membrane protein insertion efficiency factor YidD [Chromatiaceae bacterium]|nr:membrane protein insertion efficiency factor YidD [Chromatiaceae bacterium]